MVSDTVLGVADASVTYGDTTVVRRVSLDIGTREKVGLVGESGSGKSTLAMSLISLLPTPGIVDGGTIVVGGKNIVSLTEKELNALRGKEVALVSQDPLSALDPVKTIGYQLAEAIRRHTPDLSRRQVRDRAVELLTEVGVPDPRHKLDQYPHQYSGGMRQRVAIAMAISCNPRLLLADEPTTALDVTTQAQVMELLDSLVDRLGISVLLITHDLGVVLDFCDRVLVMYAGRIVESAPAEELFRRPSHPYTRALLSAIPRPGMNTSIRLESIPGTPPSLDSLEAGCAFAPRCKFATAICRTDDPVPVIIDQGSESWAECHHVKSILDIDGRPAHD